VKDLEKLNPNNNCNNSLNPSSSIVVNRFP